MREIKFRAWDKNRKIIVDVESLSENEIYYKFNTRKGNTTTIHYKRKRRGYFNLMQYTGLKDKNGVEIYEGDIVERTHLFDGGYGETHTGEVVYDREYARYVISRPQKYTEPKTEDIRNTLSDKSSYEVIGNIYENSELLKEKV